MRQLQYVVPLFLFTMTYGCCFLGGWWTWALPVFAFGVVPLLDQVHRGSEYNLTHEEEQDALSDPMYSAWLLATVPLHIGAVIAYLIAVSRGTFAPWELLGATATLGVSCGAFGINVAHELGHRREKWAHTASKMMLLSTLYLHFFIEHNRGHHRRIGTRDDPATSRRGEWVYSFWVRSIVGGWRSAWQLESARLERKGIPWWSWQSEMVRYQVIQLITVAAVAAILGWQATLAFLIISVLGALTLETVNYLEHYGLQRERKAHGGYERVQPHHSWNSNRPMGRLLLFDLTRHSDHHAHASRPYQVLRHHDNVPELPYGYPATMMLSLVPPLFDRVMGRALEDWQQRQAKAA